MSDLPKPKPGSLRDRIAAFEKQPAASTGSTPPAPRPKPGGLQWKPRQSSPPPAVDEPEGAKRGGMSASDAKETIGKGVSLKERMAALNNRGAFGAPNSPPPVSPKPNVERPKWKPPPVVTSPEEEETSDAPRVTSSPTDTDKPAAVTQEQPAEVEESQEAPAENDEEEAESQRRAAIAARMARLGGARLGMAPPVVGRKPKPAEVPKEEDVKAEPSEDVQDAQAEPTAKAEVTEPERASHDTQETPVEKVDAEVEQPSKEPSQDETLEDKKSSEPDPTKSASEDSAASKASEPASALPATESSVVPPPPSAAPLRMPVPAAPRRAAPPRKKAVKSPAPVEPEAEAAANDAMDALESSQATGDSGQDVPQAHREAEIGEVSKAADPVSPSPEQEDKATEVLVDQRKIVEEPAPLARASEEDSGDKAEKDDVDNQTKRSLSSLEKSTDEPDETSPAGKVGKLEGPAEAISSRYLENEKDDVALDEPPPAKAESQPRVEWKPTISEAEEPSPAAAEVSVSPTEEEDEEARRKRVAEKIAKMGGRNPLAPPPRRQSSTASHEAASPVSHPRRQSSGFVQEPTSSVTEEPPVTEEPRSPPPPRRQSSTATQEVTSQPRRQSTSLIQDRASSVTEEPRSPPASKQSLDASISEDKLDSDEQTERTLPSIGKSVDDDQVSIRSLEAEKPEQADDPQAQPVPAERESYQEIAATSPTSGLEETRAPTGDATEDTTPTSSPETTSRPLPDRPPQSINRTLSMHEDEPRVSVGRTASTGASQPPRAEPETSDSEYDERDQEASPLVLPPRTVASVISAPSPVPSPPPTRVPAPNRQHDSKVDDEASAESDSEPIAKSPPPPHRTMPPPPPGRTMPPPPPPQDTDDEELSRSDDEAEEKALHLPSRVVQDPSEPEDDNSALPTPPRRGVPPPPSYFPTRTEDNSDSEYEERHTPTITEQERAQRSPDQRRQSTEGKATYPSHEVLDEDEGDPIDPGFHSPHSVVKSPETHAPPLPRSTVSPPPVVAKPSSPRSSVSVHRHDEDTAAREDQDEEDVDAEQARRRTIAERMAKLGGIKFGAAPPMGRPMPVTRREPSAQSLETQETSEEPASQLTEEEEEIARKQRIAAKMATMGGMRFGMVPPGVQATPSPPPRRESRDDHTSSRSAEAEDTTPPPLPPSRPPPPPANRPPPSRAPPPPAVETESEYESTATSDDGVKVEAEESEIEEVSHRDAAESETFSEEEAPPVPTRPAQRPPSTSVRKSSSASTSSGKRPPIPSTTPLPPRKSSTSSSHTPASPRGSTHRPSIPQPQSDFVMVDEAVEIEAPRPPPQKRSSMAPTRSVPPPPGPSASGSSQWEMPSVNFDDSSADLSLSWSEDSTMYPTEHKRASELPQASAAGSAQAGAQHELPSNLQLSADELMSVWGKVGVHLFTASNTLYENSKKMLIGDGTYAGFIRAAMKEVPNALAIDTPADTFGYLVYHQNGASVQKRASEIMPGDVVVVTEAKFKGHKGLQAYSQHVGSGVGGSTLGIVSEFEPKKSKVRVYQANQHVGQQTVESVSYRLDDLKTGVFKVFRVLEA